MKIYIKIFNKINLINYIRVFNLNISNINYLIKYYIYIYINNLIYIIYIKNFLKFKFIIYYY